MPPTAPPAPAERPRPAALRRPGRALVLGLGLGGCGGAAPPTPPLAGAGIVLSPGQDGAPTGARAGTHRLALQTVGLRRDGRWSGPPAERWTVDRGSLAQAWTLRARPAGTGPLALVLRIPGARLRATAGVVEIRAPDGHRWSWGPVAAWDATGRPLPLRLALPTGASDPQDARIELILDDTDARWPLEVDPVLRTAAWSAAVTHEALAGLGDLDGDGFPEVGVSARGSTSGMPGQVLLYPGGTAGPGRPLALSTTGRSWRFGRALAGAGDLDGDGLDELVVGEDEQVLVYAGTAGLFGTSGAPAPTALAEPTGAGSTDFGEAVAGAGDVDGDGHDDLLVGAPAALVGGTSAGQAWLFLGSATGPDPSPAARLDGSAGARFGGAVAGIGDVNGDGYDDVAIGGSTWDRLRGYVEIWHGSATGLGSAPARTLEGSAAYCNFGQSLAGAGDVDGDGYDDLIIGAFGCAASLGSAELYRGSAAGIGASPATTLTGATSGAKFGQSVDGVGDVDGDGHDDVIVGGHGTTRVAAVHHGSTSGLETTARPALSGGVTFGKLVAGAGDVDGDGHDDVLIGDPGAGIVEWHPGDVDGDGDGWTAREDCDDGDTALGPPQARWTDADGDGHGDPTAPLLLCTDLPGTAPRAGDCDDTDPAVHPDATERPGDGVDQDCDGLEDCHQDRDGDGVRTAALDTTAAVACTAAGLALASAPAGDCDDTDAAVYPGAPERCDGRDTDCDGAPDAPPPAGAPAWVPDADGDGAGATGPATTACSAPPDHVAAGGPADCDDTDPTVRPGAPEQAGDGIDQDCDGADLAAATDGPAPADTGGAPPAPATSAAKPAGCATLAPAWAPGLGLLALVAVAGRRRRGSPSPLLP